MRPLSHPDQLRRARARLSADGVARLRDREASLITLVTESPRRLATIRAEIAVLERRAN